MHSVISKYHNRVLNYIPNMGKKEVKTQINFHTYYVKKIMYIFIDMFGRICSFQTYFVFTVFKQTQFMVIST